MLSNKYIDTIPLVIKKIIATNKYDVRLEKMTVMPEQKFQMLIGSDFKWQLSYADKNRGSFTPYVTHTELNE